MIYSQWGTLQLSRLMLGTVQFGMPYGIANRTGQPDYRDVLSIVDTAFKGGVNCFDTAAAYGTSEAVLGRAMRELRIQEDVIVVTKVRALISFESADARSAEIAIRQSIDESRQRLKLDCLHVVLFHREADAVYLDILEQLKHEGKLLHAGVSCDARPGAAMKFADDNRVSALQLPGNILDHRHKDSGVFGHAASRDIAVFIRSVYLQGLLAMSQECIPEKLREVVPALQRLERMGSDAGMTLTELALRYMLSQNGVTSILVGVETEQQMKANLEMFSRATLPADILSVIESAGLNMSETLLTPSMWLC